MYENKRVDGKVVTRYIGQEKKPNLFLTKTIYLFVGLILVVGAIAGMYYFFSPTGNVAFEVDFIYKPGEQLDGLMKFRIKEGELVPKDSIVTVNYGAQSKTFALSELVNDPSISGDFYAEGKSLSGSGEGYGVEGSRIVYPTIDFDLLVSSKEKVEKEKSGEETKVGEVEIIEPEQKTGEDKTKEEKEKDEVVEEGIDSAVDEEAVEESGGSISENSDANSETSSDSLSESSSESSDSSDSGSSDSGDSSSSDSGESSGDSGITGGAISEIEFVVNGKVSKENDFSYNLEDGQSAKIVSGSVKVGGEEINENSIFLEVFDSEAKVTTDYFINERGFGEEYLGDFGLTLYVDVKDLNLTAELGRISVELVSGDDTIAVHEEDITVLGKAENKTKEKINETVFEINETEIISQNVSLGNLSFTGEIPLTRIPFEGSALVDLSEYFIGAENYSFDVENLSAVFSDDLITLTADSGFKGSRNGKVIGYLGNESVESNLFNILVSSGAIRMTTSREKIKVGEKVKWVKNISLEEVDNITVEIPSIAENISVKKEVAEEIASNDLLTGEVVIELDLEKQPTIVKWIRKIIRVVTGRITGQVVGDLNDTTTEILLEDSDTYSIEYETPAPTAVESEISGGKKVVISGPDSVEYTDVIAFTELNNFVLLENSDEIKVYWYNYELEKINLSLEVEDVEETEIVEDVIIDSSGEITNVAEEIITEEENVSGGILTGSLITGNVVSEEADGLVGNNFNEQEFVSKQSFVKQLIPFDAYDLDGDGNVDYIEWVVLHLSNQTFEIIIEISKAEHLDSNRTFVEDVYDLVKARDGNWSLIPAGDYLRVTFEENLTSEKDITIYARAGCNGTVMINEINVPCDVYEKKKRIDEIRGILNE